MEGSSDRDPRGNSERRWRGPPIADIARAAAVGTATVDRVLNGRSRVRPATRDKVLAAVGRLTASEAAAPELRPVRIAFLVESGSSFSQSLQAAVGRFASGRADVVCSFAGTRTADVDPLRFAQDLERAADHADGLVVVAREDLAINRAIRAVAGRGVPVVCITTDLPASGRCAYVGSDQTSAGGVAAFLMGKMLGPRAGTILLVMSAPYRSQEERELGFRRVLRIEFPHLSVEARLDSRDDAEFSHHTLRRYLADHGPPLAVYNVAGGNVGIARALDEGGLTGKVAFIGHELNANSRILLESGSMDFVIGHDIDREVALSVAAIEARLRGQPPPPGNTPVRIYTKYSCN